MRGMVSFIPSFGLLLDTSCGFTVGNPQPLLARFSRELLVSVWVRALPSAHHCSFSLLQVASSVPAALEDFVKLEKLDGRNCFNCSR